MNSNYGGEAWFKYLCRAFCMMDDENETAEFLSDLCTVPELRSMCQRLQVSKLLFEDNVYRDIVAETRASTATISRVNRTLNDPRGRSGKGYKKAIIRMTQEYPDD